MTSTHADVDNPTDPRDAAAHTDVVIPSGPRDASAHTDVVIPSGPRDAAAHTDVVIPSGPRDAAAHADVAIPTDPRGAERQADVLKPSGPRRAAREADVVVVGARAAGAATALLLARAGLSVIVVDRDKPGADTLSTHALMRGGVVQLQRWGLLDEVIRAGTPAIRETTFHYATESIWVPIKPGCGVDALYAPRRTVLDPILVAAASEAGAAVRYGETLVGLRTSAGSAPGTVPFPFTGRAPDDRANAAGSTPGTVPFPFTGRAPDDGANTAGRGPGTVPFPFTGHADDDRASVAGPGTVPLPFTGHALDDGARTLGGGAPPRGTPRVAGVDVRDRQGRVETIRALLVIGADGRRSTIARLVGAPITHRVDATTACAYGYYRGLPCRGYEWAYRTSGMAGLIPTNDDLTCVFVAQRPGRLGRGRSGLEAALADASPELADRVRSAEPSSPVRTFVGQPGHLRKPWGPGWALVGDAGSWKDPISAHGLTDALRDAELLAGAAVRALAGDDETDVFGCYEATRDRLTLPILTGSAEIAVMAWDDDRIRLLLRNLNAAMNEELQVIDEFDTQLPVPAG